MPGGASAEAPSIPPRKPWAPGTEPVPPTSRTTMSTYDYQLGRHDRITIDGAHYRPAGKRAHVHHLQLMVGKGTPEEHFLPITDDDIADFLRHKKIHIEQGYYSRAHQFLLARGGGQGVADLSDAELRTIAWKVKWCVGFNQARAGLSDDPRPDITTESIRAFIELARENVYRWYVDTFGTARPPGRKFAGQPRKIYDYPGATTLRDWLILFEEADYDEAVFRPGYDRCGNRHQLDRRVLTIVEDQVSLFASRAGTEIADIYQEVEIEVAVLNSALPRSAQVSLSRRSITRRVRKLPQIQVDLGHLGPDRTARKYEPLGEGLNSLHPLRTVGRMERVEMDDWRWIFLRSRCLRRFGTTSATRRALGCAS